MAQDIYLRIGGSPSTYQPPTDDQLMGLYRSRPDLLTDDELARVRAMLDAPDAPQAPATGSLGGAIQLNPNALGAVPLSATTRTDSELRPNPNAPPLQAPGMAELLAPVARGASALVEALDRPPVPGMAEGTYTTPMRMMGTVGALIPEAVGTVMDMAQGRERSRTTASPLARLEDQTTWMSELEHQGVDPRVAMGVGTLLDLVADPIDLATGGATALATLPLGVSRSIRSVSRALPAAVRRGVVEELTAAFPRLDSYTKPTRATSATALNRRFNNAGLSQEAQSVANAIVQNMPRGYRISPAEVEALAAGRTFTPERTTLPEGARIRGGARPREYVGAPLFVRNADSLRQSDDQYLQLALNGVGGRNWYRDSGRAAMFAAGDNPRMARDFSNATSITSPTTGVTANTGFGIKAINQRAVGDPIETGRFPERMSAQIVDAFSDEASGVSGPKRGPFADAIARGGGFFDANRPRRGTHDIWDMEARGYSNPDGSPKREGFSDTEHRWADEQDRRLVERANAEALGGFTDWDVDRLQAAAWTGVQLRAKRVRPGQEAVSIATAMPRYVAQGSRETVPGKTTGHLAELLQANMGNERRQLDQLATDSSGIYDAQGRDRIALAMGGLSGGSASGPGVFQGSISPGRQTLLYGTRADVVTPPLANFDLSRVRGLSDNEMRGLEQMLKSNGSLEEALSGKFGTEIEQSTRKLLEVVESAYGLAMGQDAVAGSMMTQLPTRQALAAWRASADSPYDVPMRGARVNLGATPTDEQMQRAMDILQARGADANSVALVFEPGAGIRLGNLAESALSDDAFNAAVRDIAKELGGTPSLDRFDSIYASNDWRKNVVGQDYLRRVLPFREQLDPVLSDIARNMNEVVEPALLASSSAPLTPSPAVIRMRQILANEGLGGLEAEARRLGVPVLALLVATAATTQGSEAPGDTGRGTLGDVLSGTGAAR